MADKKTVRIWDWAVGAALAALAALVNLDDSVIYHYLNISTVLNICFKISK